MNCSSKDWFQEPENSNIFFLKVWSKKKGRYSWNTSTIRYHFEHFLNKHTFLSDALFVGKAYQFRKKASAFEILFL